MPAGPPVLRTDPHAATPRHTLNTTSPSLKRRFTASSVDGDRHRGDAGSYLQDRCLTRSSRSAPAPPDSQARTGTLKLANGQVQTPAFVPLATRGSVKMLEPRDVEALGYEMVLGNTFHLYLSPGHDQIREYGGLGEFMRWKRPIITDSGGFQVFSMGHGSVADEIKGRNRGGAAKGAAGAQKPSASTTNGAILSIAEDGVRFRSYVDGSERFMAPENSMEVQAALNSDIALVFDECTPFHVTRDYTARSTERTHRWLARALPQLA